MTQVLGIPYRRHGPSAALREFLDPLDPGDYFDCGRARLHGLDDALLDEARSRGRTIGDDAFLLVATDMGLIFCRPSISFAIAARWEDVNLIRPRGDDPVVLPVTWPRHGELKFTLSKRLAGNIFRRWLQLRMHAARRAREADPFDPGTVDPGAVDPGGVDPGAVELELELELDRDLDLDRDRVELELGLEAGTRLTVDEADHLGELDDLERIDTVDPRRSGPARTGDDLPLVEPLLARAGPETLADGELERVSVPRPTTVPPSWVGSAVSLAASLVVISTVVLIAAVSVSLWRGASTGSSGSAPDQVATGSPDTTIDHERFRVSADPVGKLGTDGTPGSAELAPSAAGGASQSVPSSSQQLLAAPDDPVDPDQAVRCSSNYSGCVPDVAGTAGADVDCVGQGDGPYFADGEVMVLGDDVYGLDSDGDRIGCEADQVTAESLTAESLTADPAASGGPEG